MGQLLDEERGNGPGGTKDITGMVDAQTRGGLGRASACSMSIADDKAPMNGEWWVGRLGRTGRVTVDLPGS